MLGLGVLGNPTQAWLLRLATNGNAFTAELQLTHGSNGTTDVYVDCTGETIAIVEIPHPTGASASSAADSSTMGIENAPLNGGSRLLEWRDGSAVITNRSGVLQSITNNWICVGGHYGLVCGPDGWFQYQAAKRYSRGTAEDTLRSSKDELSSKFVLAATGTAAEIAGTLA